MTSDQLKLILRHAVIAALPVALQAGCTVPPTPKQPMPPTDKECWTPSVYKPGHSDGIFPIYSPANISTALSFEECTVFCQQGISSHVSVMSPPVFKNFTVHHCTILPKQNNSPTQSVKCAADYTEIISAPTGANGCPVPGRMPAGLHIHDNEANSALGQYFAQMAAMETAAVTAFRYLVRELEASQAPAELITLARAAIGEEINHAKLAGMLAKAHDASIPRLEVEDFQLRSLFDIALENAIEGCVNETFAAACGLWQQEQAEHEAFRSVIAYVTEDECRHAALSWAIHEWAMPQLTSAEQAHIRQAQTEAVDALAHNFLREEHPAVRRAVGLPEMTDAARLFQNLRTNLWEPRMQVIT